MDNANIQTQTDFEAAEDKTQEKQSCPHDNKCDQKNSEHLQNVNNPRGSKRIIEEDISNIEKCSSYKHMKYCTSGDSTKLTMLERLEASAPYNLFFNKISMSEQTHNQLYSIEMKDLLCPSLGKLKCSLQINFYVDMKWLMEQYGAHRVDDKPLTLIYGRKFEDVKEYVNKYCPHVTDYHVRMRDIYGTHHSKIGIFLYEEGFLRVVVSTANLSAEDWNEHNQGVWISQALPRLPTSSPVEEVNKTNFKSSLITYLQSYKLKCLQDWIAHVKSTDFSGVNVFLVCSMPGQYTSKDEVGSHMFTMANLLEKHCELPEANNEMAQSWKIIAQASSIGNLGKAPQDWLLTNFLNALSMNTKTTASSSSSILNVVYPSKNNVNNSYYEEDKAGCLYYTEDLHNKQLWLKEYLRQWKADQTYRTRVIPHIKTYCRVSPCSNKLAWFLLTSANLSKAAWSGNKEQHSRKHYVRSYEIGILFLPKFFVEDCFEVQDVSEKKKFAFMYDLPVIPYDSDDQPWFRQNIFNY